jgi:hypothetical protein
MTLRDKVDLESSGARRLVGLMGRHIEGLRNHRNQGQSDI